METEAAQRYRSRILREFKANHDNPFNSPPSSTGSHGTVSPTMTSVFSDIEGDSTRRLNDDIIRRLAPSKLAVNWEAAHRKWPQYYSMPKSRKETVESDDDTYERPMSAQSKENRPPVHSLLVDEDSTQELWTGSNRRRSEMQPRADNESELSILLKSPGYKHHSKLDSLKQAHRRSTPPQKQYANKHSELSPESKRQASISNALAQLRKAASSPKAAQNFGMGRLEASPDMSSAKSSMTAVHHSPNPMASPDHNASHVPSFFMPDVSHLGDFVTGTLRFSGSLKNGVPILVKHGKVHDKRENPSAVRHEAVDGIEVPENEEKIFVSMDMIRDEVVSLQEHHDKVQEYAMDLQERVESLEAQLAQGGNGHNKYNSPKSQFDNDMMDLHARLEKAAQRLSATEIQKDTITTERDRIFARLEEACRDITKLTKKLSHKDKELETSEQIRHDNEALREELAALKSGLTGLEGTNASLRFKRDEARTELENARGEFENEREVTNSIRVANKALTDENAELRQTVENLQQEVDAVREELDALQQNEDDINQELTNLREDNHSLVGHNDKYFAENKKLKQENLVFEQSIRGLQDENAKLKEQVEFLTAQLDQHRTGPKSDLSARIDDLRVQFDAFRTNQHKDTNDATEDDRTEENMTSAFIVPDITIKTNESAPMELTEDFIPTEEMTGQTFTKTETQNLRREGGAHKVAFALPAKPTRPMSRRSSLKAPKPSTEQYVDAEDSTDQLSVDRMTENQAVQLSIPIDNFVQPAPKILKKARSQDQAGQVSSKVQSRQRLYKEATTTVASEISQGFPALSTDAQRVLNDLCEHSCTNCTVCARIASRNTESTGKTRVVVSRPVPVTDRQIEGADVTMRPVQSPGHALAMVIKSLEDESRHLQVEITRLQARYNDSDKSRGRRERSALASRIGKLLKQVEAKNDQIYSLFDVLEGQKAADQAMTEEELEMTVMNITGMNVREVTNHSDQYTWEGFQDI